MCFTAGIILAGGTEITIELIRSGPVSWQPVLQVAIAAGLISYMVMALYERGFLYTLITAAGAAILAGILTDLIASKPIQVLLAFGFEIIFVALIFTGDRLGQAHRLLRILLGVAGGLLAAALASGIAGSIVPSIADFWQGIGKNIHHVLELGAAPPLALFLTRLCLKESKTSKPEEELE